MWVSSDLLFFKLGLFRLIGKEHRKAMPPKVVKRGGAARRGGRLTRSALKAQNPPVESVREESDNIGELSGSDAVEAKEETPEVDKSVGEENRLDGPKLSDSFDDPEAAANLDGVVLSKSKIL